MSHRAPLLLLAIFALLPAVAADPAHAADGLPVEQVKLDRPVDFTIDIRPILKKNCIACHHNPDPKAKLSLESVKDMAKGGDLGPAIEPGKVDESLLFLVSAKLEEPHMPPKKNKVDAEQLTPRELGLLKLWIEQGAKGPNKPVLDAPKWQSVPTGWNAIYAVDATGDGQYAAAGRAGRINIYHIPSRRMIDAPQDPDLAKAVAGGAAHHDAVQSLAFSADGRLLASGGYRNIKIWKRHRGETTHNLGAKIDPGKQVAAISPDGKHVAVTNPDKTVQLYDADTGKPGAKLTGHGDAVNAVAFSADGKRVATASNDKTARVWNLADGKQVAQIDHDKPVTAAGWVDDTRVVTATDDNQVRVWEPAAKPKELKKFGGHGSRIIAIHPVAGQPHGIITASHDGTARLFDANAGKQVRAFSHGGQVRGVGVAPDAQHAVTISSNNSAKLYRDNGQQIAEVRTDGLARIHAEKLQAEVGFARNETKYRENVVKEREKTLNSEKDAVKKATEALATAEKTRKEKTEAHDKAAKEFADAEKKFKESEKTLADAKAKMEAAPKAIEVARAELNESNAAVNDLRGKRDAAVNAANQAKTNLDNAEKRVNELKGKLAEADKAVNDAKAKLAAADKAIAEAKDDAAKKKAEEAKKAAADVVAKADATRKAAEAEFRKAETTRDQSKAALTKADAAKKAAEEAYTKAEAAKKTAEQKVKDTETAKRDADNAFRTAERTQRDAKKKYDQEKKELTDAKGAMKQAELNLTSAKRRLDKAKEAVPEAQKAIDVAKADVEQAKKDQKAAEDRSKQANSDVGKSVQPMTAVAVSPDGSLAAVGTEDGRVFTYGVASGELGPVRKQHDGAVVAASFRPDGKLVTLGADGTVKVADALPTWKLARVIKPAESTAPPIDRVISLAFSPDGKQLASGGGMPSREGELVLWNVDSGSVVRECVDAHSDTVFDVHFAPDGKRIATAASDRFAKVFDVETGKLLRSFEGHTHHVLGVSWNRDGRTLATSSADNTIKVWNVVKGERIKTVTGFNKEISGLRHLGYSDRFAVAWGGGPVRIVQENGRRERDMQNSSGFMHSIAVTDDGNTIVAGGENSTLYVWNDRGEVIAKFDPPQAANADSDRK